MMAWEFISGSSFKVSSSWCRLLVRTSLSRGCLGWVEVKTPRLVKRHVLKIIYFLLYFKINIYTLFSLLVSSLEAPFSCINLCQHRHKARPVTPKTSINSRLSIQLVWNAISWNMHLFIISKENFDTIW